MNIKLPDLNNVQFTQACSYCGGRKVLIRWDSTLRERTTRRGRLVKEQIGSVEMPCNHCAESGVELSPVGLRLLAFLELMGTTFSNPTGYRKMEPLELDDD